MLKTSLPSSLGATRPSNHNVPHKTRMATSATVARLKYVPRRRDATRSSRSTMGRKVMSSEFNSVLRLRDVKPKRRRAAAVQGAARLWTAGTCPRFSCRPGRAKAAVNPIQFYAKLGLLSLAICQSPIRQHLDGQGRGRTAGAIDALGRLPKVFRLRGR